MVDSQGDVTQGDKATSVVNSFMRQTTDNFKKAMHNAEKDGLADLEPEVAALPKSLKKVSSLNVKDQQLFDKNKKLLEKQLADAVKEFKKTVQPSFFMHLCDDGKTSVNFSRLSKESFRSYLNHKFGS